MTTATKTNNRSKKLQNWTRRCFSVPSSRQCDESETTEIREKIHVKRNSTNGTEHSEKPSENKANDNHRSRKQSLPQHYLQLTSTRHKTNASNKLLRFAVQLGIMYTIRELIVATPRDKPHDRHHSTMTETHPTRK